MEISELIQDADLVAAFGLRAGLLQSNDIFEALQKAQEKGASLAWGSPEIVGLQKALNIAIGDIEPVTLLDLRGDFKPFHRDGKVREWTFLQVFLMAFAFVLVFLGAHFSIWQEKATGVLLEIKENKQERQKELIADLIPLVMQFENAVVPEDDLLDAGALSRDAFRNKVEEARLLAHQIISDTSTQSKLNTEFYLSILSYWYEDSAYAAPVTPVAVKGGNAPGIDFSTYSTCFPSGIASVSGVPKPPSDSAEIKSFRLLANLVASDDMLIQGIRCLIGLQNIERQLLRNDYEPTNASVVVKLKVLVLWLLPAIYGMLGAVIFHLRICMNPLRPDPQTIRVVLRIFLSGFAGVAMCWFWRPNSAGEFEFGGVAIGALAAAFLVGYGIDIFFNLLDRLVTLANKASQTVGAEKTLGTNG